MVGEACPLSRQGGALPHGAGARFAASPSLARFGAVGTAGLQLGMGGYPSFHHGFFFDIVLDGFGASGVPVVAPHVALEGRERSQVPAGRRFVA